MNKITSLYDAFKEIHDVKQCENFLHDLCTVKEIKVFSERWLIARLLYVYSLTYNQINEDTGASVTTVTRVARSLRYGNDGYNTILGLGGWHVDEDADADSYDKNARESLYLALIHSTESQDIFDAFLSDLCTPFEIKSMNERWVVVNYLVQKKFSYNEIQKLSGVSVATITRVARFLNHEKYNGYKSVSKSLGIYNGQPENTSIKDDIISISNMNAQTRAKLCVD